MEIIPDHSSGNIKCKEKLLHSIYATKGDITEYSIAECMFLLYKDEFIYYNEWYLVSNCKKIKIKNGTELRKRIPILKIFIDEEVTRIRVQIRIYEKDMDRKIALNYINKLAYLTKETDMCNERIATIDLQSICTYGN